MAISQHFAVRYSLQGMFSLAYQSLANVRSPSVLSRTTNLLSFRPLYIDNVRTHFAKYSCNYASSSNRVRGANNHGLALQTLYYISETNLRKSREVSFLCRNFSVMQRNFTRNKDEIPGSEAIFREELKNMKNEEYVRDDIDEETAFKNWSQDYTDKEKAMRYAKRAKYLGQKRQERTLTWDNIDQIRFLRQEYSDEWSVGQLAKSFDVSEQTIKKVLKSKFTPDSKVRQYQDKVALKNVGKNSAMPPSPDANMNHVLLDEGDQSFSKAKTKRDLKGKNRHVDNESNYSTMDKANVNFSEMNLKETEEFESVGSEHWEEDEDIDLEEQLEEAEAFSSLKAEDFVQMYDEGIKAPKVIQRGREFYDSNGEFLFKI